MGTPMKKVRTFQEKLEIIKEIENSPGEKRIDIAKRLGINPSTLNSIYGKKDFVREKIAKCGKSSKTRKTGKESKFSELETILFTWYQQARDANVPIDGNVIREKAREIAERIQVPNFKASNGWVSRFKERHGILYRRQTGAITPVDPDKVRLWLEELPKMTDGYEPCDIYNANEFGLFYNCLPNAIPSLKGQSCHDGRQSEMRISVLLCTNCNGSDKREPIVIGKEKKPKCFKNLTNLPVEYHANSKAWMTGEIFANFLRNLDTELGTKERNILMFVNSSTAHPPDVGILKNIKLVYFPPNCTSELQPLNKGVIKCFKSYFRKLLVRQAVCIMNPFVTSLGIDILQALHFTLSAWHQVTPSTIAHCFGQAGFSQPSLTSPIPNIIEGDDVTDIQDYWNLLEIPNGVDFHEYISFDNKLAICEVESIERLCDAWGKEKMDEEDDGSSSMPIPKFSETLDCLEKIKTYIYSHTITDQDKIHICDLENLLFRLKNKGKKSKESKKKVKKEKSE